jgi:hypothetical protein
MPNGNECGRKWSWYVNLLLGDDHEISGYATSIVRQWLCKKRPLLGNGRKRFVTHNNAVTGPLGLQFLPLEKTNAIADCLEKQFTPH